MTVKVRRELEWLRALAQTRRAASFKGTQRRLMSGKGILKPKAKAATW
jgi:hypothetical protein